MLDFDKIACTIGMLADHRVEIYTNLPPTFRHKFDRAGNTKHTIYEPSNDDQKKIINGYIQ